MKFLLILLLAGCPKDPSKDETQIKSDSTIKSCAENCPTMPPDMIGEKK